MTNLNFALRRLKRYVSTIGSLAYLTSVGMLSSKGRESFKQVGDLLGYTPRVPKLPTIAVEDLLSGDLTLQIRRPMGIHWNVSTLELAVLCGLVRKFGAQTIFEIGTFDGRTALNFALNTGPQGVVYTLDLPPGRSNMPGITKAGIAFEGSEIASKIVQLYGNSFDFDYSQWAGKMDLVFVDAGHSYECASNDSKRAVELIGNRTGVIVWHDYGGDWDGVTLAVEETAAQLGATASFHWIRSTTLAYAILGNAESALCP
jgi:predicted O-methyltransferase YrrM